MALPLLLIFRATPLDWQLDLPFHFIQETEIERVASWAGSTLPHAIILEVEAAEMAEVCHATRANRHFQTVPLLVVTDNSPEARLAALDAKADDVLTAPLDAVEVSIYLNKRRAVSNAYVAGEIDILTHDLHNPLGTLVPTLDLLRNVLGDEELRAMASDAFYAARRQQFLLDNLFDYTRIINADELKLTLEPLPLLEFLHQMSRTQNPTRKRASFELEEQAEIVLLADRYWLGRVVEALLDTSVRFCTQDNQLVVRPVVAATSAGVEVADNGRAVLPQYQDAVFELNHQFEARLKGSRTSVAMNLPFARAATRMMGGELTLTSADGWTSFKVTLPLA